MTPVTGGGSGAGAGQTADGGRQQNQAGQAAYNAAQQAAAQTRLIAGGAVRTYINASTGISRGVASSFITGERDAATVAPYLMGLNYLREGDFGGLALMIENWSAARAFADGAAAQLNAVDQRVAPMSSRNGWFGMGMVVGTVLMAVLTDGESLDGVVGRVLSTSPVAAGVEGAVTTLPRYLYHYASEETAALIETSQLGIVGEDKILYLTPNGALEPLRAGIELALPQANTASAVFRVPTSALAPDKIMRFGPVSGNFMGRAGGGIELMYKGTIPIEFVTRIR